MRRLPHRMAPQPNVEDSIMEIQPKEVHLVQWNVNKRPSEKEKTTDPVRTEAEFLMLLKEPRNPEGSVWGWADIDVVWHNLHLGGGGGVGGHEVRACGV